MIPAEFDYVRPPDIGTALAVLDQRVGEAKVLAGGFSLLPLLKLRLAQPALLVDIRDLAGIDGIEERDGQLRIGARATHDRIGKDPTVVARYPLLREAARGIGDPQVRNWGTIGGSLAHADPSGDWPAVLIAEHGTIVCRSVAGERLVAAREWCIDTFTTAIEPNELVTEVRIPVPVAGSGGAYEKLERRSGDFATVGVAVQLRLESSGRIADIGIGLTAVANAPYAAREAENLLRGQEPSESAIRSAGASAAASSSPVLDRHGPVEYKRAMVAEMTERALRRAVARARGQQG